MKVIDSIKDNEMDTVTYVKDLNVRIDLLRDRIVITDLTNAMKTGKVCAEYVLVPKQEWSGKTLFKELMRKYSFNEWYKGDNEYFTTRTNERKSVRTYSPFFPAKKQNMDKLKVSNVAKAILAGQIVGAVCTGRYTDDYKYDYATDYSKGEKADLHELAEELTSDSKGWCLWRSSNGKWHLSCYSFLGYELEANLEVK